MGVIEDGVGGRVGVDLILLVQNCKTANASARDGLHLNRGDVIAKKRVEHGWRHTNEEGRSVWRRTNEEGRWVSEGTAAVISARLKPSIHSMVMTR